MVSSTSVHFTCTVIHDRISASIIDRFSAVGSLHSSHVSVGISSLRVLLQLGFFWVARAGGEHAN